MLEAPVRLTANFICILQVFGRPTSEHLIWIWIRPILIAKTFQWKPQINLTKTQKNSRIHPLGFMNVCTKCVSPGHLKHIEIFLLDKWKEVPAKVHLLHVWTCSWFLTPSCIHSSNTCSRIIFSLSLSEAVIKIPAVLISWSHLSNSRATHVHC